MSSRASSVRPPYITIRSSRARAPSYIPLPDPPGSPAAFADPEAPLQPVALDDITEHTTMTNKAVSYFSSFISSGNPEQVYSLAPSETSNFDSLSLPLPGSPKQTSFTTEVWEEDGRFHIGVKPISPETVPPWSGSISAYVPSLLVLLLFPLSSMLMIASIYSLPITTSFPRTLGDLADLARELQVYFQSSPESKAHVLCVLSVTALWKHAWSVPGSVLLNVLSGVLLSPFLATLLMTSLTACGSVFSSLLATPLAPVLSQWFPKALSLTRNALEGGTTVSTSREKTPIWVRLSILRLIGVVPWSGINIACGVAGVSLFDCLLGASIGTLPWTAVTCQVGDIMHTFASTKSPASSETLASLLRSPSVVFKLAILTVVSLIPILARHRLKGLVGRAEDSELEAAVSDVELSSGKRWWFKHLRRRQAEAEGNEVVTLNSLDKKLPLPNS